MSKYLEGKLSSRGKKMLTKCCLNMDSTMRQRALIHPKVLNTPVISYHNHIGFS
jgi:hypothetical protein